MKMTRIRVVLIIWEMTKLERKNPRKIKKIKRRGRSFKKKRCAVIKNTGYSELYVIASNSYSEDTEMKVEEGATKTDIKRAFAKSLKSKSVNRNLLSSFVCQIA